MNLFRGVGSFVAAHGGWPQGYVRLVRRGLSLLLQQGPINSVRAASTFQERNADLRLEALRLPAPLPQGAYQPLYARPVEEHREDVEIVVCIHNAREDVQACLESVTRNSTRPAQLVLVDDGSMPETKSYLEWFSKCFGATLIRNDSAVGYTRAANQGLRSTTAPFVLLLNSDTIVSTEWLDRMLMCARSDENIGLVGPLSNTASWQSIPEIEDNGDWAINSLPSGVSVDLMAARVAKWSAQVYPRVAFLNGFCLLLRREMIEDIGIFDEAAFGAGYGEENDYCLRAAAAGWTLCVADDVFIYHAQSKSYTDERRKQLSATSAAALERKHGLERITLGVARTRHDRALAGIRARSRYLEERETLIELGCKRFSGRTVFFLLPVRYLGGGPKVVLQEAKAMRRMGVDARILNLQAHRDAFEASLGTVDVPVDFVSDELDLLPLIDGSDAVVATVWATAYWLPTVSDESSPRLGYYVQDFEPDFYELGSSEYKKAFNSYTRHGNGKLFTKTKWNQERVAQATGVVCTVVGPSVDVDLFRPRVQGALFGGSDSIRVAAMIRPSTERRNAAGTIEVLRQLHRRFGERIEILTFGTDADDPLLKEAGLNFPHRNFGVQSSEGLALLFNETDVFLDLSSFQAMGLTAMEAMCCGVASVVPKNGGAVEFARDGELALVVDSSSTRTCLDEASRLIEDSLLRAKLARNSINEMPRYFPEGPAYQILDVLFS